MKFVSPAKFTSKGGRYPWVRTVYPTPDGIVAIISYSSQNIAGKSVQGDQERYWGNIEDVMWIQKCGVGGGKYKCGSRTYVREDPTENECIRIYGVSQREKCTHDIWSAPSN